MLLNQTFLMLHAFFGVLGVLLAVAVFMNVLNANEGNEQRTKQLSLGTAAGIVLSYIIGGYWYVVYYGHDRDIIKAGPWPWAHNFFMEVKEHLFFVILLLAVFLPIAVYGSTPLTDRQKRNLILGIAACIVLLGLFTEGAGGIISKGVTIGLMGR